MELPANTDFSELADVQLPKLNSIERDYIKVLRIQFSIVLIIVCGVIGGIALMNRDEWLFSTLFVILLMVFIFILIFYPKKVYKYTQYGLVDDVFYVQKGLWFRKRTAVAQNRIQHTDVSQGPLERKYNLATLIMHTAGMKEADIQVSGLKHVDAMAMRDHLIQLNKRTVTDSNFANNSVAEVKAIGSSMQRAGEQFNLTPTEQSMATSVLALRLSEEE